MKAILEPLIQQVESSPEQAILTLFVPGELFYFKGHFPGHPVLPGVVQTDWAVTYGARFLGLPTQIKRLEVIKFQNLIQPDTSLELRLNLKASGKMTFAYDCDGQMMSSGRIVYREVP